MLQERDKLDATPLISENIIRPPEANDIDCFIPSNIHHDFVQNPNAR
jgi:hypothetical protein